MGGDLHRGRYLSTPIFHYEFPGGDCIACAKRGQPFTPLKRD
jgi:hypothetical protein